MFGSDYAKQFGLPGFPWTNVDAQGGFYQPAFSGMEQGQPVPGTPGAGSRPGLNTGTMMAGAGPSSVMGRLDAGAGPSANPSVEALRSGSPLAGGDNMVAQLGGTQGVLNQIIADIPGAPQLPTGAGAPAGPGAGRGA